MHDTYFITNQVLISICTLLNKIEYRHILIFKYKVVEGEELLQLQLFRHNVDVF
jgi:hypothetical protein